MRIRRLAAATAASAACFVMLAGAPPVGAAGLDIYYSGGTGDGIVANFAIKPTLFDRVAEAGALHTETKFNSSGGGTAQALSAPVNPGAFAIGAIKGAVGCAGLPGGWLWGTYPPYPTCPRSQEFVAVDSEKSLNVTAGPPESQAAFKTLRDHLHFKIVHAYAEADFGEANSFVKTAGYQLVQDENSPPIILVRDVGVTNSGALGLSAVTQTVQVETKGIEILGGLIKIGSIVATATTGSDGTTGVAKGSFVISDVTVTMNGETHKARIDNDGVTIDATTQRRKLQLNEAFSEAMLQAGITIRASDPIDIVDGPQAEESVPGLQIGFSFSPPSVAVPSQLAPVFSQVVNSIPTKCVYEFVQAVDQQTRAGGDGFPKVDDTAHVPLCFGAGVLPGAHNVPTFSLNIASAQSFTVASQGYSYDGGGLGGGSTVGSGAGGFGGTNVLGEQFSNNGNNLGGSTAYVPGSGQGNDSAARNTATGRTPVGLVARMPSTIPLVAGVIFLLLAVGAAVGPSLRHARAS